jgi:Uma2 family endonuclease
MATSLRFGPADHGREVTDDEAEHGDFEEGYRYELIDGRLYVTPLPDQPHDWLERYVYEVLRSYSRRRPKVIDVVTNKARVFVPGARRTTTPQPDISAYRNRPKSRRDDWRDFSPLLVVEILGSDDDEKDFERNVVLYLRVPTIQEYWVFDIRDQDAPPSLRVHRRRGRTWETFDLTGSEIYSTPLLPGFRLVINPPER